MTALPSYTVVACAFSDIGRVRESNEDSFLIADLSQSIRFEDDGAVSFPSGSCGSVFAVADGMGGAAGGGTASRLALTRLYAELQGLVRKVRSRDAESLERVLIDAVGTANSCVFEAARRDCELSGMGTTLTVLFEVHGKCVVGQIGDSRAYLLREIGIRQLTRDQSLIAEQVAAGHLTEQQARRHPQRNILLQALGVRPEVELVLRTTIAQPGDVLLLCSDGLHSQMAGEEMYEIVAESASPEAACRQLVQFANNRGGPDNITVVLIQFLPA